MAKVKVKVNVPAVKAMMRSKEMQSIINGRASQIQAGLGAGYEVESYVAKTRCVALVGTGSEESKKENMENNTILKAMK